MRLGIRYQLLLPLVTLMAGVVGMSLWTALSSARLASRRIEKQLDDIAGTVASVTFPRNLQTLRLMKGLSGAEFLLCDDLLEPIRDDRGQPMTTLTALPGDLPGPADTENHELGPRVHADSQVYFCRGVVLRQEAHPGLVLYTFYPETLWKEAWWQAVRPALVFGGLGGLAAFALAVLVAARITRPIQDIERRTRLIAAGDFSPMPLPHRDDEVRDLARSINDMAQRLTHLQETVLKTERLRLLGQVSGGLAHQLRNGVTGANLAVQLHAQECPGADAETLAVALRQLALVEMHLKRFLHLGKAIDLRRETCSLHQLVGEAVTLLGPKCKHTGIDLRWQPQDPQGDWSLAGDPNQLGHLFLNVLTNAIEAAGPGGWVEVRLCRAQNGHAMVEVLDSGPGPNPEVAARLFEPFVTGKPEGVGLGLAVARQVAEAHGGAISWAREPHATCFRIDMPLESE